MTTEPIWARIVLPGEREGLLLDYLEQRFRGVNRAELADRLNQGGIVYEPGIALGAKAVYRPHTPLFYRRAQQPETRVPFEISIIHQDEHILVADKPPFLTVVPAGQHWQETLLVRLRQSTGIETLVPMHRIDRETAGLVMFTIRPDQRGPYQKLFESRAIRKVYEAIAPLRPDLELPLTHESHVRESEAFMQMQEVPGKPANAVSHIQLVETRGSWGRYAIEPITGRKHQIRVHMAALGIPIANDRIYPVLQPHAPDDFSDPLKLLARQLEFIDPLSGRGHVFSSLQRVDFPADLP
jgi:tRNA pseudouridine32 synthase / 23S rRNA pseudouridine746 synthase